MANTAADPKAAPLADDLKGYALGADLRSTFDTTAFPKNFFCTLCNQLAIDSYKLLCCNKAICASCQEKLAFPTTCPSCDHSPLEADSCTPNKALRNTMRVWLQKQKKKEGAKAAAAPPIPVEATPAAPEVQPVGDAADRPIESVEEAPKAEAVSDEQNAAEISGDAGGRTGSAAVPSKEESTAPQNDDTQRRGSDASQHVTKSAEPSTTDAPADEQNAQAGPNGGMMGNNPMMMNGMPGQMGYGFPNQANFNNGMGFGMNGMSNMMGNGGWNGMNSMDFNNMNGMYGNYGGNMGMGMNDMSAMNYGGGYGGWNGMGVGYGNYNGFNQMGGYNQSGSYPEMMNQFPKNNFQNQNQNRFPANQGGAFPQRNTRNGSHGSFGPGLANANSRPGSRSGPGPNRDGQSPDGNAGSASDAKPGNEQTKASAELTEVGKDANESTAKSSDKQAAPAAAESGDVVQALGDSTDPAGADVEDSAESGGLKPIQAFDSGDAEMDGYNQTMMDNGMPYQQGMMNQGCNQSHMDSSFAPSMNMGYNNCGPRGGFNNGAYGAAKVLIDQPTAPVGVGVAGAPTGPRAMREGRPNTGFSSRVNKRERSLTPDDQDEYERRKARRDHQSSRYDERRDEYDDRPRDDRESRGDRTRSASVEVKYRSSRRDKDKHRSLRSHRDRSKEHRRRHRSRSSADDKYEEDDAYVNGEKESDGSPRRKHRSDNDKYRDRSRDRDRERDRKDRKERDRDYDYDYERSRDKDKDRKRRRDRVVEQDERDYDDDKHRSSRRSRKDRERERSYRYDERDRDERDYREEKEEKGRSAHTDREDDIVAAMMKKRAVSPPLNAPTGPAANGFSIKGRSKTVMPPPVQPPTGPRNFQPPKGPAADRERAKDHRRKSSNTSTPSGPASAKDTTSKDHYAAERERNARERDSRERVEKPPQHTSSSKSLHQRISSSSQPSLSSKRSRSDIRDDEPEPPRGPKADVKPPSGPASHRDKRRKSGTMGDDNIANLFTAGLRKNAKRRGGVRMEGDAERDMERVERERELR
ncbi:hypothetical protein EK21DRAFT_102190 [Setomelanomma holmii]|uniref:RING-type domain-containing protein n=1 Tax=Setomelanomma holmii TaxID=210430 RepID=A0A9P4LIH4_9PLEO|nr:hypothetical protein EK21DRAFT_102190 [Setomelanomma holmii]